MNNGLQCIKYILINQTRDHIGYPLYKCDPPNCVSTLSDSNFKLHTIYFILIIIGTIMITILKAIPWGWCKYW